ncbi:unnamed protein product [Ectocarpus sp. CCAP 1310/34]|nr:unnamed protein product [Ectocarpus sp. CCAP 1310/34]
MAGAKRTCGRTAVAVLAVATLLASDCASAQEMPGKGMTCWDKRELCDLNCVYATTAEDEDFNLTDCSTGCMTAQAACTDSAETLAYVEASCAKDCTLTYDGSLTKCNQKVSDQTKNTYGANLDACANIASGIMDDCMEDCYGEDRFNGWTPMKEEGKDANGIDLPGLDDGVWRRPFRSESVIYGRLRGELDPK